MFLAGKVEETPRPLKDVILVSYEIIHKRDPAAVQKIKQKEVYEQQKELILIGERVVLATLGFDLNVHHPYKPLVEAMKKFKAAQDALAQVAWNFALAQVAWNFVNDGLRTSLCLQFKPDHIAAGAIFLAAKFLKVKLPSDGEVVWWQEFDVTPRQLEEISNQMLELYEQNRVPPPQGSEMEVNASGGLNHRGTTKAPVANEESLPANSHAQAGVGVVSTLKPVTARQSWHRPASDNSTAGNHGALVKGTQNLSNDSGSSEMGSVITDQMADGEAPGGFKSVPDQIEGDNEEGNGGRDDTTSTREWKNNGALHKSERVVGGQNMETQEGSSPKSPQDGMIKMIDKDKVKAALEKRRKSRGEVIRKKELVDEDDLIERELEDGVELDAKDEKIKRERRQSWSKTESPCYTKDQKHTGDRNPLGTEVENIEEGEMLDDASPKFNNRKRKERSPPDIQSEAKKWTDSAPGCHHRSNHQGHP
eukprot:XP_010645970.1 PREDICTED: cyclin-T1-5 isoform X2 [Vitis vinifera]